MNKAFGHISFRTLASVILWGLSLVAWGAEDAGTGNLFSQAFNPRAVALGGAYVAAEGDAYSLPWNPASLDSGDQMSLGALHATTPFEAAVDYLGFHYPTAQWGGLGFGMFYTGVSDIPYRDANGLANPALNLNFTQFEGLFGYGKEVLTGLSLGLATHIEMQSLGAHNANAAAFDFGLSWVPRFCGLLAPAWQKALVEHLRLAASLDNLAQAHLRLGDGSADLEGLMERVGGGWNQKIGRMEFLGMLQWEKQEYRAPVMAAGLELKTFGFLALRGGVNSSGWSYGLGVSYFGVDLDYAYEPSQEAGLQRFSLAWHFGPAVSQERASLAQAQQMEMNRLANEAVAPLVAKAREEVLVESKQEELRTRKDEAFKALQYSQGLEALSAGRYEEAASAFEQVEKMDPHYLKVKVYLPLARGKAHYKQSGGLSESMLEWYRQGTAKFLQGDYQGAISIWKKILAKDPNQRLTLRNIEEAQRRLEAGGSGQGGQP